MLELGPRAGAARRAGSRPPRRVSRSRPTTAATCSVIGISIPHRLGQGEQQRRGGRPLDHPSHPLPARRPGVSPRREGDPEAPVAGLIVGAGEDEVAESRESPIRVAGRAPTIRPSRSISPRPRETIAARVLAPSPSPVRDPRGDREDVLDRAPEGDPGHVVVPHRHESGNRGAARRARRARSRSAHATATAAGRPAATSPAKVGPDTTAALAAVPRASTATSCSQRPDAGVDALGRPGDPRAVLRGARHAPEHFPERVARDRDQDLAGGRHRRLQLRLHGNARGEGVTREITTGSHDHGPVGPAASASRVHRLTRDPLRARSKASAVPHGSGAKDRDHGPGAPEAPTEDADESRSPAASQDQSGSIGISWPVRAPQPAAAGRSPRSRPAA